MLAAASSLARRPASWWCLAAIFGIRDAIFAIATPARPDTLGLLRASRALLHDPAAVYGATAAFIRAHQGLLPPPEGPGYLGTAPNVWLGVPFGFLPDPAGVAAWTVFDAACLVAAVALLARRAGFGRLEVAVVAAITAYFPPVFAEVSAGQRGGPLLLLLAASVNAGRARAGAFAGLGAALKLYPGAMLLAIPFLRAWTVAGAVFVATWLVTFAPVGGPIAYVTGVLAPSLTPSDADCAIVSTRSLWQRVVGGEPYSTGASFVTYPLHLPALAAGLTILTIVAAVAAVLLLARRAPASPPALAAAFALGAIVPGEAYPYQLLPLLPLLLLAAADLVKERRWGGLAVLLAATAGMVRPPCESPFPNLWTVSALAVFAVAIWHYRNLGTGPPQQVRR